MKDSSPVLVRLRITDAAGRTVFRGHTAVTPRKFQPNGAGCPPSVWIAGVTATGSHTLTPTKVG